MGQYLTNAQVQARMDRTVATLYDDDGSINTIWIDDDISAVEGLMNGHLSVRYVAPVTAEDDADLLRALALDLFVAQAYRRLPGGSTPDAITTAEATALGILKRLAAGELRLSAASADAASGQRPGGMIMTTNTPEMTRARLRGF